MDVFIPIAQLTLGVLSLPLLTALGGWVWKRVSKEARLHADVERLARVYPTLPEGKAKTIYAERVNDAVHALNIRLDPLFKRERRRKRKVVATVAALTFAGSLFLLPNIDGGSARSFESLVGVALGGIIVAAFWLIERDTKRQRAALKSDDRGNALYSSQTAE